MTEWLKTNAVNIFIAIFIIVEVITWVLVLWEHFTGNSIVDIIFEKFEKDKVD